MNGSFLDNAVSHTPSATANDEEISTVRAQQNLFEQGYSWPAGSLDDGALVRSVLIKAIKKCKKSRAQIAEEISRLTGRKLTETALNKFAAESRTDYR